LQIKHLISFVAVGHTQSINQAAEILNVAQPALSRQIHQLEDDLGVSLFDRGPKGVSLTESGRNLMRDAEEFLTTYHKLRARHTKAAGTIAGKVIVTMPVLIAKALALPLIYLVEKVAPNVDLQIMEETRTTPEHEYVENLLNNQCDLVVSYDHATPPIIRSSLLAHEQFFLIGRSQNREDFQFLGDLKNCCPKSPILIPQYHKSILSFLLEIAQKDKLTLEFDTEFASWDDINVELKRGQSFTIAPQSIALSEIESGELDSVAVTGPLIQRPVYLHSRIESSEPKAKAVIETALHTLVEDFINRGIWQD
jgi:LysR family nitrogen assimilation transcriptional regulator